MEAKSRKVIFVYLNGAITQLNAPREVVAQANRYFDHASLRL